MVGANQKETIRRGNLMSLTTERDDVEFVVIFSSIGG